jgi:hypothetical protein
MIESLLGGDPEVSGSLAYTPYGASRKKRPWYRHIIMQILCMIIALVILFFGFLTVYGLASFGNDALNVKPFGHIYSVPVGGAEPRYKTDDMIDMRIRNPSPDFDSPHYRTHSFSLTDVFAPIRYLLRRF